MRRFFWFFLSLGFTGLLLGAGGLVILYLWASQDLPSFKRITDYNPPLVTTVYARDNQILGYFYKEKRFLVTLDECPEHLIRAFLAAEDAGFYQHQGLDPMAIFRAFLRNLSAGRSKQGGSTITQQVVKSLLLTPERSLARKLKEAILSYRLEQHLTKDEILTIYLNQIYLGSGSYGVEAAARTYFGKRIQNLTLAQAAVLAGLPPGPSKYSPLVDPEAARARQKYVLSRLLELGWISADEHKQAMAEPLVYSSMPDPTWTYGAYYLEEVRRFLIEQFGEDFTYGGGLHVRTAMDPRHQREAERALRSGLLAAAKRHGWVGPLKNLEQKDFAEFLKSEAPGSPETLEPGSWVKALVESVEDKRARVRFGDQPGVIDVSTMRWARVPNLRVGGDEAPKVGDARKVLKRGDVVWASVVSRPDPKDPKKADWALALEVDPQVEGALVSMETATGDVRALVGGYSFARSQFNRATQARRQPGSSFKPIVYSAAMDNGFTPASIVMDSPFEFVDPQTDKVWRPENYEEGHMGPMILRTALAKSRNLVTIRVAQQVGMKKIIERARALGIEGNLPPYLSMSLGAMEVTPINLCQAYTAFARTDGAIVRPRLIYEVKSAWGEDLVKTKPEAVPAISPQNAFIMASLLQEVVQAGTGTRAKALKRPVGGKTGTTNNEQDAWFVGFTPYLLTGVYVGYDQVQPMGKSETGGRAACPIFTDYRLAVENEYPYAEFKAPAQGIVMAKIDPSSGLLANASEPGFVLPFLSGTQPTVAASDERGSISAEAAASGEDVLKQIN